MMCRLFCSRFDPYRENKSILLNQGTKKPIRIYTTEQNYAHSCVGVVLRVPNASIGRILNQRASSARRLLRAAAIVGDKRWQP